MLIFVLGGMCRSGSYLAGAEGRGEKEKEKRGGDRPKGSNQEMKGDRGSEGAPPPRSEKLGLVRRGRAWPAEA